MSDEMVSRLFEEFKNDKVRWTEFEKREFPEKEYSADNPEARPGRAEIVHEFVQEKLGEDHGYETGRLGLRIRMAMER